MSIYLKMLLITLTLMPFGSYATDITKVEQTITNVQVFVTLDSEIKQGEKVKVDYGKGLKNISCKSQSCTFKITSAMLPKGETKLNYTIGFQTALKSFQQRASNSFQLACVVISLPRPFSVV